jgi:hypothetical protein
LRLESTNLDHYIWFGIGSETTYHKSQPQLAMALELMKWHRGHCSAPPCTACRRKTMVISSTIPGCTMLLNAEGLIDLDW